MGYHSTYSVHLTSTIQSTRCTGFYFFLKLLAVLVFRRIELTGYKKKTKVNLSMTEMGFISDRQKVNRLMDKAERSLLWTLMGSHLAEFLEEGSEKCQSSED